MADNSTKSKLVKKIFEEYTDYEKGLVRSLLGFGGTQEMPHFTLYPPLGTDEAKQLQLENCVDVDEKNFAAMSDAQNSASSKSLQINYVRASTSNTICYAVSKDVPSPEVKGIPINFE